MLTDITTYNRLVIGGRLIVDMYLYFKRMKLDKYSLDFISNKFLGEGKNDMPHGQMTEAFFSQGYRCATYCCRVLCTGFGARYEAISESAYVDRLL